MTARNPTPGKSVGIIDPSADPVRPRPVQEDR